jgi:hypothetical protein
MIWSTRQLTVLRTPNGTQLARDPPYVGVQDHRDGETSEIPMVDTTGTSPGCGHAPANTELL